MLTFDGVANGSTAPRPSRPAAAAGPLFDLLPGSSRADRGRAQARWRQNRLAGCSDDPV